MTPDDKGCTSTLILQGVPRNTSIELTDASWRFRCFIYPIYFSHRIEWTTPRPKKMKNGDRDGEENAQTEGQEAGHHHGRIETTVNGTKTQIGFFFSTCPMFALQHSSPVHCKHILRWKEGVTCECYHHLV